jgi:hypothetical protein
MLFNITLLLWRHHQSSGNHHYFQFSRKGVNKTAAQIW